jgi:hypothetical protein
MCSISTGSWMSYAECLTHILVFLFVHLCIILILVLVFYSGLSGRVRMVYLFSLCVVSLLSGWFTASALVWVSNFLKYLVFHFFYFLEHCVNLYIFMDPVVVKYLDDDLFTQLNSVK